jgi:hypothetical protein
MNHVREIAEKLVREMGLTIDTPDDPAAARHYRRLAVLDYAAYLKNSPGRSLEANEMALQNVYIFAEKAISLGVSREAMDESFARLRNYWLPKLEDNHHAD